MTLWGAEKAHGKPINIYILSERMRELLKAWINDCKYIENVA